MNSLRTLVLTRDLPFPTVAGVDLRNWQNLHGLRSLGEVGVFGALSGDPRGQRLPPLDLAFWRSSTDSALAYPLPPQRLEARTWIIDPTGHPYDAYYSEPGAAELEALLVEFDPQLVVVEGLWLYRYLDRLRRHNCRLVLDCHNIEGLLYRQIAETTREDDLPARIFRKFLPERTQLIERLASQSVDSIWMCSEEDARLMKELYNPSAPISVVPNAVNPDEYDAIRTSRSAPPDAGGPTGSIVFTAWFGFPPNAAGAMFLIEEVLPRLASRWPDCQLVLAGAMPTPPMVEAAQKDPRITVTGTVADTRPYLAAASVTLVPLFQGSGTRFKILEAFAANVPVISTAKGAEGLRVEPGRHLLLAETADEFAAAVERLRTDDHLASQLATNGLNLVTQSYSWHAATERICQAIRGLGLIEEETS